MEHCIEIETDEDRHEEFLHSLYQAGEINVFQLEAERQLHGLSTLHIRRKMHLDEEIKTRQLTGELMNRTQYERNKGRLEICVNGNLAKCQLPVTRPVRNYGGNRGKVKGFSRQSRLRMMRMVSGLDKAKRPLFITMTYPDEFEGTLDGHEIKERQLKNFWKRLVYENPGIACIWKLEYEERKSGKRVGELFPHLHLLVWGLYKEDIEEIREFVRNAWWEICGELSKDHYKAGTRVERIRSHNGTMAYITKYMSKEDEEDQELVVGRWWGVKGRANLPQAKIVVIDFLKEKQFKKVIEFMVLYAGLPEGDWRSLEIFIDGRKLIQELERIVFGPQGVRYGSFER